MLTENVLAASDYGVNFCGVPKREAIRAVALHIAHCINLGNSPGGDPRTQEIHMMYHITVSRSRSGV